MSAISQLSAAHPSRRGAARDAGTPAEIDRRCGLSLKEFQQCYAAKSLPVILTDATDHWPARKKWNLDFFESNFNDKVVTFEGKEWKVGDVVRKLKSGPVNGRSPYLSMVKLDEQFPELWADVGELAVARHNRLRSKLLPYMMRIEKGIVAVFIGAKGSGLRLLHWDSTLLNVFISQIHGDKDFVVFRPEDTPYLYAKQSFDENNHSLLPDAFDVDLDRFPEFEKARPIRLTVKEGETLFLPAGWWHATSIHEHNVAIAESAMDAFSWHQRNRWFQEQYSLPTSSFLKRHVLRHLLGAYMACVDVLIGVKEKLD